LARSIETNNPEVEVIVLLIDERPEEVTDVARSLERGEVVASPFDRPPEEHTAVAELTVERAKRRVETGADVCILVDGITRLARAYNVVTPASGRVLTGGVDVAAIYPPKRFMGAARKVEEGGSLTILSTMLLDTGSEMDAVLYEEFKGMGNMQVRLDRRMAERGLFPAIDIENTWTRRDEDLRDADTCARIARLRNELADLPETDSGAGVNEAGVRALVERLAATASNAEFIEQLR
jgi:transcription termination factor Rho